jgi:diguanylate cyclase (GGDEF)-like protein
MADSETPQPTPEREPVPISSDAVAPSDAPAQGPAAQDVAQTPGQPPAEGSIEAGTPASGADQAPQNGGAGSTPDWLGRLRELAVGRSVVWIAVAVVCLAAGVVASVLGAHAVANSDASKARTDSRQASSQIASTLRLAQQHEEDFALSASTFFAGHPRASRGEFEAWAKWGDGLLRFPELQKLSLVALVSAGELPAFGARVTGHPVPPAVPVLTTPSLGVGGTRFGTRPLRTTTPTVEYLHVVPSGKRQQYCFAIAGLPKSSARYTVAGLDYCAITPGLLATRDSGQSLYSTASAGHTSALGVATPVYRNGAAPSGFTARRSAFVGWLREVLVPTVLLQQALQGHPESAVRLRHRSGASSVVFTSGSPQPGAESTSTSLRNGWTARTFGGPVDAGVLANWHAVALMIAGILASVLLGLLIFVLGGRRAPRAPAAPKPRKIPHEDLYDPLTGLPNKALMMDRAGRMLARAGRESGLLAGALFIDIDWFENVNEKLGPAAGDQLLSIVADRLQRVVRSHDTVGRLEGDEFVVLVESAARGARLDSLARRVIEALHKPVELDDFGPSIFLTASIGVAFGRYAAPDELLRDARLALEASKAAGKDRYTLFNANMRSVIEGRGVLEVELNNALQQHQLFLLYEPVYGLASRRVVALEALLRWRHPAQGVIGPENFMQLAEETGLSVPIGRWMLEEACTRAAAWDVGGHRVGISVAVSTNQLTREGFATDVRRALLQSGIDPALLTLEVSETTVMRQADAVASRLDELRQLGVRIAVNEFGSGYAHHSDLQRLPLDFLIVDKSSLAASDDEDYRSWLLQAILVLGRDLSLTVIASGVESYEEMINLQAMGCTMAQGPFLGEPAPAEAVVERLLDSELAGGVVADPGPLP